MAVAVFPESESPQQQGPRWPFIPAALMLALFVYVVPYGFLHMYLIHSSLASEVEEIAGFGTIDRTIYWYPSLNGGEIVLRPEGDQGIAELWEAAREAGFDGRAGISRTRSRDDEFDADMMGFAERDDGTILATVSVFDTDLVASWPLLVIIFLVIFCPLVGLGKLVQSNREP